MSAKFTGVRNILILLIQLLVCLPTLASDTFKVMTFNVGTASMLVKGHSGLANEYGSDDALISDKYYGNGLAWKKALLPVAALIVETSPDIIGLQEVFDPEECKNIPIQYHREFICNNWQSGDLTVLQLILGDDYQVACHLNDSQKCIAVKKSFGKIRGCDSNVCLRFLEGQIFKGCGGRTRLGRAVIDRKNGESITVTHIHATSGLSIKDKDCRNKQFRAIFEDWGDGVPGASGPQNIVFGDFNTDPDRMAWMDKSAKTLSEYLNNGSFRKINSEERQNRATYLGIVNIDHIISDSFQGDCFSPGITAGTDYVLSYSFFDHVPSICKLHSLAK